MHLGEAEGGLALQAAVAERMFAAHFCEGKALDDRRVLQRVGPEAGLDEHRVSAVLSGDEYASAVREDEREAARLQLASVPFVLADRRIAMAGPQPVQALLDLLREAWEAREAGGSAG
jgi:predicted DsbA family dithiol-disulfide isomerase